MFHLEMLSVEQFRVLRDYLAGTGFTEEALRQRLAIPREKPLDLVGIATRGAGSHEVKDELDALIHLFVLGEALEVNVAQALFRPAVWDALLRCKLILAETRDTASHCTASAALFPARQLFLTADRWTNIDHSVRPTFADIVYPVMTKSGKQYLDYIPTSPCEDFLEVCAGTAPAALLAANTAKNIWATDITERSLDFAKFNAALNGINNVSFAQGDLFQPVDGRQFDRIAAHPPYMPVLKPAEIYSAGGALGDEIAGRLVSELPGRLKPGGRFYCRTLGMDRANTTFEQHVRNWLGPCQREYDVALFVFDRLQPRRFALDQAVNLGQGRQQVTQWEALFEKNHVEHLLAVILVIQRVAEQRPAFTLRRLMKQEAASQAVEWALRWETLLYRRDAAKCLWEAKPIGTAGAEVTARHVLRDGELVPQDFKISVERPFDVEWSVQPWMPLLLTRCDGQTAVADLFEQSKSNGWIMPETPKEEFCGLIGNLVSGGFLRVENFRWPEAAG